MHRYTTGCIATIPSIAAKITEDRQLLELASRSSKLRPDPRWAAKESGLMQERKFRES